MNLVTVRIEGINPLLMHNVRLANPLEPIVQQIKGLSSKRKKTVEDIRDLSRMEFEGGLYWDEKLGPYIPGQAYHKTLVNAAKAQRLGTKVNSGIIVSTLKAKLLYDGPRDVQGLWDDGFYDQRMVTVDRSRTLRTRPCFNEWAAEFELLYSPNDFDDRTFDQILEASGRIGLLDYRPHYGTFQSTIKAKKSAEKTQREKELETA